MRIQVGETVKVVMGYPHTITGTAVTITERNGVFSVHTVNSLNHPEKPVGVPRNITARLMSEGLHPEEGVRRMKALPRSSGYHHGVVFQNGKTEVWSIETTADKVAARKIDMKEGPSVHTNHCLDPRLIGADNRFDTVSSRIRYARAKILTRRRKEMTSEDMKRILEDTYHGPKNGIYNERSVGRAVIDLEAMKAHFWLKCEEAAGWKEYDLKELL